MWMLIVVWAWGGHGGGSVVQVGPFGSAALCQRARSSVVAADMGVSGRLQYAQCLQTQEVKP